MDDLQILQTAVTALDDKQAKDIEVIKVGQLTSLGDYLVIATGNSTTQVKALADEVEHRLSQQGLRPHHIEGRTTAWYLLDYTSVMVHVFLNEARNFYALERLWADGEKLDTATFIRQPDETPQAENN